MEEMRYGSTHFTPKCINAKRDYELRHVCLSVRMKNSAPTGRIFMNFDILGFFEKSLERIQDSLKSDKNK